MQGKKTKTPAKGASKKNTMKEKQQLAGEIYDLFVQQHGQEEVGYRLGSRDSFIKWQVRNANLEALRVDKKQIQKELKETALIKERSAKRRKEIAGELEELRKNMKITKKGRTQIVKRKAPRAAKKGQRSPVKKSAEKSIFAGASEIAMTQNKIAVTRSSSKSSNGRYSERTTRDYHDKTPENMRAFQGVLKDRDVKKVTVTLK